MAGNNEQFSVEWTTQRGVLNSDTSPDDMSGGNLFVTGADTGAYNVRNFGTNLSADYEFIIGNEYVFQPDPITLQNKKFRIYLDVNVTTPNRILNIYDANGNLLGTALWSTNLNFNVTYTNAINAITAAFIGQTFTFSPLVTVSTTEAYFDLEITTVPYWDYSIEFVVTNPFSALPEKLPVTIQEAIDQTLTGEWNLIGSYDLQSELILWWTTQRNLPLDLDINSITNNGSGLFRVETTVAHGLLSNEKVIVQGSGLANGQWIITVVSPTEFDLQGTPQPFVLPILTTTPVVTTDPNGIGELGRATKNQDTQAWTYYRLVRAKALNWVTKHQQDTLCKKDALRKYYRYTDDYNPMGNLYDRTLVYQNDCLLTFVDPRNTYSYENIGLESQFIQNGANYTFEFTTQDQSGGSILSGNSRFAVRLITDTLVPTTWSSLTNPVPAASSSETGTASSWSGDNANVTTPKIDNFLLSGDLLDNYKWAQIAVINYQGDALTGYLLPKVLITSDAMAMKWTGNEATEDLDVGTVQEITVGYKTALSIDELDGRIIFSNLTSTQSYDLTEWASQSTYSVLRKELDTIGSQFFGTLSINEYEKSQNVNQYTGYMLNETYRFAWVVEFYDNSTSLAYWAADITIDNSTTDPRRINTLPDLSLNSPSGDRVYVPYIEFDIDWNFLVDGVPVRDIVKKVWAVRVDMTSQYREVLGSGVFVGASSYPTLHALPSSVPTNGYGIRFDFAQFNSTQAVTGEYHCYVLASPNILNSATMVDYIWASGFRLSSDAYSTVNAFDVSNPTYNNWDTTWSAVNGNPTQTTGQIVSQPQYGSFYCFDSLCNDSSFVDPQNGDVLKIFGIPNATLLAGVGSGGSNPIYTPNVAWNYLKEIIWDFSSGAQDIVINASSTIEAGNTGTINGQTYSKAPQFVSQAANASTGSGLSDTGLRSFAHPSSPVLHLNTPVNNIGNTFGLFLAQIFRKKTDKFGDKIGSKYISTGAFAAPSQSTIDVFGGDVFTQKAWFKHRQDYGGLAMSWTANDWGHSPGMGGGIGMYTQNRVNSQMIDRVNSSGAWRYPNNSGNDYTWLEDNSTFSLSYNQGYNIRNQIQSYTAYDPDQSLVANDFPVRLIYGQKAQPEQASDTQRIFLPLDFTDLQYKDGEIVNHRVINSELCAWQAGYFSRLYFHSNRLLTTTEGSEAIVGTGDAFSNRPLNITSYGCPNKWAIGKGRSSGGNDVAYWLNPVLKCFIRFGGDGTTNQGLIHGMDSFFRNNTSLLIYKDTPADGEGTCCVWDEQYKEMLFTARAWNHSIQEWVAGNYSAGEIVQYGTTGFEEVPAFYEAIVQPASAIPTNTSEWSQIPLTNPTYYNLYTICYSEIKNGLSYFTTSHPKIYASYNNGFLSPSPVSNTGKMYEHNRGVKGIWYDNQTADAYFDAVVNMPKNVDKTFVALWYGANIEPYHVDLSTQTYKSYLDKADFRKNPESFFTSTIKNDSTVTAQNPTGLNTLRTSRITGNFLIVRTWISRSDAYQKIKGFITKMWGQARKFSN